MARVVVAGYRKTVYSVVEAVKIIVVVAVLEAEEEVEH